MGRAVFCRTWAHTYVIYQQPDEKKAWFTQGRKLQILDSTLFSSVIFEIHKMPL